MKNIVALGTLREDITIDYDFSRAMNKPEVKVKKANYSVGGSVYNTCYYLSLKNDNLNVSMCTSNYSHLVQRVKNEIKTHNYRIITSESIIYEYPISIIGVRKDGEKQILSYDSIIDQALLSLFKHETDNADFVYTSFYEINNNNYVEISNIFQRCHIRGGMTMVDLCPIVNQINDKILNDILCNAVIISGNEYEYKCLLDKLRITRIDDLMQRYSAINHVFVKKGSLGAEYRKRNKDYLCYNLEQEDSDAVNTTGCGDVFNAMVINGFCNEENDNYILNNAIIESRNIAKGGLPWI